MWTVLMAAFAVSIAAACLWAAGHRVGYATGEAETRRALTPPTPAPVRAPADAYTPDRRFMAPPPPLVRVTHAPTPPRFEAAELHTLPNGARRLMAELRENRRQAREIVMNADRTLGHDVGGFGFTSSEGDEC